MFPISIVLDPRSNLGHIPYGEKTLIKETLLNTLESRDIIQALSTILIDDLIASLSHNRSKVMMPVIELQVNMSTSLDEKSIKVELED